MARGSTKRGGATSADAIDAARHIMLRATAALRSTLDDDTHVQARDYAAAAAAAGRFRGRPSSDQDATTRNHLASRFQRRLENLLDTMRSLNERSTNAAITMLPQDPDPVFVDAADLSVLDEGLMIVVPDMTLFDRLTVRDLELPPNEAENYVALNVMRDEGVIKVVAYAMSNATYGVAGIHLDDQGAIVQLIQPSGVHDDTPLDETMLERLWTIIGAGARRHGRTLSKARKTARKPEGEAESPQAETAAATDVGEAGGGVDADLPIWDRLERMADAVPDKEGFLPAILPGAPPLSELVKPIAEAPFDEEAFDRYADHMAVNAATRILLDVFSTTLVKGRLPLDPTRDLVDRMFADHFSRAMTETVEKSRRKVAKAISTPEHATMYARLMKEAMGEADAKARSTTIAQGKEYNALLRLMAMHALEMGPIETCASCQGDGTQAMTGEVPFTGVVVAKDRTLFDIVRESEEDDDKFPKVRREVPLTILYRVLPVGVYGVIHQMDARHTNIVRHFAMPVDANEETDTELDWALRNVLAPAIERHRDTAALRQMELDKAQNASIEVSITTEKRSTALGPAVEYAHGLPTDRPMRRMSQVSLGVSDYAAATAVVDAWFDRTSAVRGDALMLDRRSHELGWRLEHASDDDAHVWAVSVQASRDATPRIEIVLETTDTRAKPSLPAIVRQLATETPTTDLDGIIAMVPPTIASRPQMRELMAALVDPDRRMPILVLTSDDNGEYMMAPAKAAEMCAGALRVAVVTPSMTREMKDSWGQPYTVFNGAARIYQPGFDPDRSNPLAHQRFMPGNSDTLRFSIQREIAATVRRYQIEGDLGADLAQVVRDVAVRTATPDAPREDEAVRNVDVDVVIENGAAPGDAVPVEHEAAVASEPEDGTGTDGETAERPATVDIAEAPVEAGNASEDVVGESEPPSGIEAEDSAPEEQEDLPDLIPVVEDEVQVPLPMDMPMAPQANDPDEAAESSTKVSTHREAKARETPVGTPTASALEDMVSRLVAAALAEPLTRLAAVEDHIGRVEAERDTARAQVQAVQDRAIERARQDRQLLEERENESDELLRIAEQERDEAMAQRDEALAERDEAFDQVTNLFAEISRLKADMRKAGIGDAVVQEDRPSGMADVGRWANDRFAGRLVVHQRTMRTLRKTNYEDVDKVVSLVEMLAGPYVDARRSVEGAHQRFVDGIAALHVDDTPHNEEGGPEAAQSSIAFEGRKLHLDRHLKARGTGKRDRGALRIYFTFDQETSQVVVGWMPDHLTNALT